MGDDFRNLQVRTPPGASPADFCQRLVRVAREFLLRDGYRVAEVGEEPDRSLAFSPAGDWVTVYDSTGTGWEPDPESFAQLALELSQVAPVVDIEVEDSAVLHLRLSRDGRCVDRFSTAKSLCERWASPEEEAAHRGDPSKWVDLLPLGHGPEELHDCWSCYYPMQVFTATAHLLEWIDGYCTCGYTIDYDGVPVPYRRHLAHKASVDLTGFTELYFVDLQTWNG